MTTNTKRGYARSYFQTPILFAPANGQDYYKATMYNNSVAGMSFESKESLQPGTEVLIKVINETPDLLYSPEAYKIYRAQVKWCKKIQSDDDTLSYWIGVKFKEARMH